MSLRGIRFTGAFGGLLNRFFALARDVGARLRCESRIRPYGVVYRWSSGVRLRADGGCVFAVFARRFGGAARLCSVSLRVARYLRPAVRNILLAADLLWFLDRIRLRLGRPSIGPVGGGRSTAAIGTRGLVMLARPAGGGARRSGGGLSWMPSASSGPDVVRSMPIGRSGTAGRIDDHARNPSDVRIHRMPDQIAMTLNQSGRGLSSTQMGSMPAIGYPS